MNPCTRELMGSILRLIWALSVYSTSPKWTNLEHTHVKPQAITATTTTLRSIFVLFLFISVLSLFLRVQCSRFIQKPAIVIYHVDLRIDILHLGGQPQVVCINQVGNQYQIIRIAVGYYLIVFACELQALLLRLKQLERIEITDICRTDIKHNALLG